MTNEFPVLLPTDQPTNQPTNEMESKLKQMKSIVPTCIAAATGSCHVLLWSCHQSSFKMSSMYSVPATSLFHCEIISVTPPLSDKINSSISLTKVWIGDRETND
jgi:hypothetical protein